MFDVALINEQSITNFFISLFHFFLGKIECSIYMQRSPERAKMILEWVGKRLYRVNFKLGNKEDIVLSKVSSETLNNFWDSMTSEMTKVQETNMFPIFKDQYYFIKYYLLHILNYAFGNINVQKSVPFATFQ